MKKKTALLVGATGLIGSHCLNRLLCHESYERVMVLARRPLDRNHPKLMVSILDFDHLTDQPHLIMGDDVFCCLGTTMKKAGSRDAFYKVDVTYPLEIARQSLSNGAKQFHLVTAIGADSHSSIFYNRAKGEVENHIQGIGFEAVHIYRPSLLLGDRREQRLGEKVGGSVLSALRFAMIGPMKRLQPIEAEKVASAMVHFAQIPFTGVAFHESREMQSFPLP